MKFVREEIAPVEWDRLRTLGARDGWLVETTDILRSGFGGAAITIALEGGLNPHTDAVALLRSHELSGADGPPGTGIVAFGTLPFDRNAPGKLDVPRYVITQTKDGRAWLTSLDGSPDYRESLVDVAVATQATQSLRSLTYQPTPDEYAHKVALAVEILRRKEID